MGEEKYISLDGGNVKLSTNWLIDQIDANMQPFTEHLTRRKYKPEQINGIIDALNTLREGFVSGNITERNGARKFNLGNVDLTELNALNKRDYNPVKSAIALINNIIDNRGDRGIYTPEETSKTKVKYTDNSLNKAFANMAGSTLEGYYNGDLDEANNKYTGVQNRMKFWRDLATKNRADINALNTDTQEIDWEGSPFSNIDQYNTVMDAIINSENNIDTMVDALINAGITIPKGATSYRDYYFPTTTGKEAPPSAQLTEYQRVMQQEAERQKAAKEAEDMAVIQDKADWYNYINNIIQGNVNIQNVNPHTYSPTEYVIPWNVLRKGESNDDIRSRTNDLLRILKDTKQSFSNNNTQYTDNDFVSMLDYYSTVDNAQDVGKGYYWHPDLTADDDKWYITYNPETKTIVRNYINDDAATSVLEFLQKKFFKREADERKRQSYLMQKQGGVLKAQTGTTLDFSGPLITDVEWLKQQEKAERERQKQVTKQQKEQEKQDRLAQQQEVVTESGKITDFDNWTDADKRLLWQIGLDLTSALSAQVPVYGTAASTASGLISTGIEAWSNYKDDNHFGLGDAKDLGASLLMDAVGLIPGIGTGSKAAKIGKAILKNINIVNYFKSFKETAAVIDKLQTEGIDSLTIQDLRALSTLIEGVAASSQKAKAASERRKRNKVNDLEQLNEVNFLKQHPDRVYTNIPVSKNTTTPFNTPRNWYEKTLQWGSNPSQSQLVYNTKTNSVEEFKSKPKPESKPKPKSETKPELESKPKTDNESTTTPKKQNIFTKISQFRATQQKTKHFKDLEKQFKTPDLIDRWTKHGGNIDQFEKLMQHFKSSDKKIKTDKQAFHKIQGMLNNGNTPETLMSLVKSNKLGGTINYMKQLRSGGILKLSGGGNSWRNSDYYNDGAYNIQAIKGKLLENLKGRNSEDVIAALNTIINTKNGLNFNAENNTTGFRGFNDAVNNSPLGLNEIIGYNANVSDLLGPSTRARQQVIDELLKGNIETSDGVVKMVNGKLTLDTTPQSTTTPAATPVVTESGTVNTPKTSSETPENYVGGDNSVLGGNEGELTFRKPVDYSLIKYLEGLRYANSSTADKIDAIRKTINLPSPNENFQERLDSGFNAMQPFYQQQMLNYNTGQDYMTSDARTNASIMQSVQSQNNQLAIQGAQAANQVAEASKDAIKEEAIQNKAARHANFEEIKTRLNAAEMAIADQRIAADSARQHLADSYYTQKHLISEAETNQYNKAIQDIYSNYANIELQQALDRIEEKYSFENYYQGGYNGLVESTEDKAKREKAMEEAMRKIINEYKQNALQRQANFYNVDMPVPGYNPTINKKGGKIDISKQIVQQLKSRDKGLDRLSRVTYKAILKSLGLS